MQEISVGDTLSTQQQRMDTVKKKLGRIKHKIAILSGKGGVGKTVVAVNLAALLAQKYKVGLLDADIDCPNIGKILGVEDRFLPLRDKKLKPLEKYGIKIASMAFFGEDEGMPAVWRGPIIHKAILQLLELVEWEVLDFLIIDMPPGTSDAALTVMQDLSIDAAVVVTTPQELALQDAIKSANLVRKFNKPFGIVENMVGDIFGSGSERIAQLLSAPFLGSLPLSKKIKESCDNHEPVVFQDKEMRKIFEEIVERMRKNVLR